MFKINEKQNPDKLWLDKIYWDLVHGGKTFSILYFMCINYPQNTGDKQELIGCLWEYAPLIQSVWETEIGGSPEPMSLKHQFTLHREAAVREKR